MTVQTCPNRMGSFGPWERRPDLDSWEEGRWAAWHDSVTWKWPWQPRTCSFCGGVHPDDALKLLEEGWEIVGTDKSYKRYLEPQGSLAWMERMLRYDPSRPGPWTPVPPVKLYLWHLDEGRVQRYNAAILTQQVRGRAN